MLLAASAVAAWLWSNVTGDTVSHARLYPVTTSTIDGRGYHVKPTPNAVDAANQLCRVRQHVQHVLEYLTHQPSHPPNVEQGVKRLLSHHPNTDNLSLIELDPHDASHTLAYNLNKSTHIFVCIRQHPPSDQLGPDDVLLYIVLHELAHTMIPTYAPMNKNGQTVHDQNFRNHNEYLNMMAERLGLLRPGKVPGTEHCGVIMPDPAESV